MVATIGSDSASSRSETAALAQWAAGITLDKVPAATIAQAKACILDGIGCMVAGAATVPCQTLLGVLRAHGGDGSITLPGTGQTLPLLKAVHFAAQAANALDFDDSYREGAPSHPGATVLPAALALAEHCGADGRELLRAVIVGYETSLRIGRAIQPTPRRKAEVYGFSTWQVFGATFAAASVLGLGTEQLAHALGLAGVLAPEPSLRKLGTGEPPPLPWIKNTYGVATENGVLAALLAAEGYVGNRTIFDGAQGFWVMAGSDRYDPAQLTQGLGDVWLLDKVGFKHYGCCRWTHTMLDALGGIAAKVDAADIARADVFAFDELIGLNGEPPTSIVDAQFHAPYLAALELLSRSPAQGLREEDLQDAAVLGLMRRVRLHHDPKADTDFYGRGALPVRVSVRTGDGNLHEAALTEPTGSSAAGGYARDALLQKFMRLASARIGAERAQCVPELIDNLERHPVAELVRLIA